MIEIIREEDYDNTKENVLPKDIKQVGKPDIGERIYVEDRVYRYLHPFDNQLEKAAYVLLGRFENCTGRQCTFVEGAIRLEEMDFDGDLPLWNDNTWGYIYRKLKKEYDNMVIVGWAMDIKGQLPNLTNRIEKLHQEHFGGMHQVLFLMDTLENEEAFYSARNNRLYRREGFYIYYGKGIWSESDTVDISEISEEETTEDFGEQILYEDEKTEENNICKEGNYRKQLYDREKKESRERGTFLSTPVFLMALVCVLGFAAYRNYQKMNEMQHALAQMNTIHVMAEEDATEQMQETENSETVKIEQIEGNIEKQEGQGVMNEAAAPEMAEITDTNVTAEADTTVTDENVADSDDASLDEKSTEEEATNEKIPADNSSAVAETEAQNYLQQGYYIVQKGDSMAGICRKIYQTTAMMDEVCKVNDIENPDAIYAGQYLTLPN